MQTSEIFTVNSKQVIACKNNLLVLYILLFKIDVEIPCLDVEDKFAIGIVNPKFKAFFVRSKS